MKRIWIISFIALLLVLLGCGRQDMIVHNDDGEQKTVIRNADDGKLRIDEQREIDFYLGNDEEGPDAITQQCLALIDDQEPVDVKPYDNLLSGKGEVYSYSICDLCIRIDHYGTENEQTVLSCIDLGPSHALASGIRVGSTEEELKRCYENNADAAFWMSDDGIDRNGWTYYYLLGDWFERYLILFEVDANTGVITGISYDLDV